jgi:hypothetical protein
MARKIDVSGYGKKESLEFTINGVDYLVPVPTIGKIKQATKLEQEAGDGAYDKLEATIAGLSLMTGIPSDVLDELNAEQLQAISNELTQAAGADEEKNAG